MLFYSAEFCELEQSLFLTQDLRSVVTPILGVHGGEYEDDCLL
jgi:hypothetical protein